MNGHERDGLIRPYGDTRDDGRIQLSFTLPLAVGDGAAAAGRLLLETLGLESVEVVSAEEAASGFSFLVAYATCPHGLSPDQIPRGGLGQSRLSFGEINDLIARELGRALVVLGACTGTDAHTLGLDAIMNMKGFAGDYGLERYGQMETHNLGSQVPNETLVAEARRLRADALLVSQVVTQKDVHLKNLTHLIELLEAEGLRQNLVVVCGGPRLSHELAVELGYDAGFGAGTSPAEVASFLAQAVVKNVQKNRIRRADLE